MVPTNEQIVRDLELNCLKAGTDLRSELKRLLPDLWVNRSWDPNAYECVDWLLKTWNFQAANCMIEKAMSSREAARLCWIDELIESCQQHGIDFNQRAALMNDEYKRVIRKCGADLRYFWAGYCAAVLLQLEYGEKVREYDVLCIRTDNNGKKITV